MIVRFIFFIVFLNLINFFTAFDLGEIFLAVLSALFASVVLSFCDYMIMFIWISKLADYNKTVKDHLITWIWTLPKIIILYVFAFFILTKILL